MSVHDHDPSADRRALAPALFAYYSPSFPSTGFTARDLPVSLLDGVFFAFATITRDGRAALTEAAMAELVAVLALKRQHPQLLVSLSIGGWGQRASWAGVLSSAERRTAFIDSAFALLDEAARHGPRPDGIDIDWENWTIASDDEIAGLGRLYAELRAERDRRLRGGAGPRHLLSAAVAAPPYAYRRAPDPAQLAATLDWVSVMGYDLHGTFGNTALHAANWYPDLADPTFAAPANPAFHTARRTSVEDALRFYEQGGLSRDRIMVGAPLYGHSYLVQARPEVLAAHGEHAPVYDANESAQVPYQALHAQYGDFSRPRKEGTMFHDPKVDGYWIFDATPGNDLYAFYSYEDPLSAGRKGQRVRDGGYRGMMFWEVQQDVDARDPASLIAAMRHGLDGDEAPRSPLYEHGS